MDEGRGGPAGRGRESPPTDRVVAIIEWLAGQPGGSSVAEIATRLELSRSTVTSILAALERSAWVQRMPNRAYTLGPGLFGVAEVVRDAVLPTGVIAESLNELVSRAGCGATLAIVGTAELTFVGVAGGAGRIPAGVGVGVRLPLTAPAGAAVIAFRSAVDQRNWLDTAHPAARASCEALLDQIRETGVGVFGLADADPWVLDLLRGVVDLVAEHPTRAPLRQRIYELLLGMRGVPYTLEQLDADDDLSISYLNAPVFDAENRAVYELCLGPMRAKVDKAERGHYADELSSVARKLGAYH